MLKYRAQAFSVVLLCLPLNTFFEDTFLGRQFGKGSVWRHILTPQCFTPHFHDFGGATTFAPDATFWRRIVWRHISIISEAPPHLCLTPHFGATLFDVTFSLSATTFGHTFGDKLFFFHRILAFEMAPRTGCRLERMFRAILAFEMAPRTGCRLECMFRAILALKLEIQNHQYNSSYHGSHSYQVGLGKFTILVL